VPLFVFVIGLVLGFSLILFVLFALDKFLFLHRRHISICDLSCYKFSSLGYSGPMLPSIFLLCGFYSCLHQPLIILSVDKYTTLPIAISHIVREPTAQMIDNEGVIFDITT
jgi:hypothetical protein